MEIYGTYKVTTEGDVEGRTVKNLGIHRGYIDTIALHLADQCYYSLKFTPSEETPEERLYPPTKDSVHVSFTGPMTEEKFLDIKKSFANRPAWVSESNYYGAFKLNL